MKIQKLQLSQKQCSLSEYSEEVSEVVIVKTSKSRNSPTKVEEVKPSNENHSKHEAEQQQDDDTTPSAPPKSPGKSETPSPNNENIAVPPTKNQI